MISFETRSPQFTASLTNVGEACWDENNSGSAVDDWEMGQQCIPVQADVQWSVPVPALSRAALIALAVLSVLAGCAATRRRRTSSSDCGPGC